MKKDITYCFTFFLIAASAVPFCNQAASAADNPPPTRLMIDTKDRGTVISPLLFGCNLEVTRRAIWR